MAERRMSSAGGFLIQSREGNAGNFEVVCPWPEGGLVHYGRANDENFKWYGPFHFGAGEYKGAAVIESDFKSHADRKLGNLEVLATLRTGEVHHYWRNNGGDFRWHGPIHLFGDSLSAPSLTYTGVITGPYSSHSSFFSASALTSGGFQLWERLNDPSYGLNWERKVTFGNERFVGVSLTLTSMNDLYTGNLWTGSGEKWLAAVSITGNVHLLRERVAGGGTSYTEWYKWDDEAVIGIDLFAHLAHQFTGRPSLIQGDFGWEDQSAFDRGRPGNFELVVPHIHGGFFHFWRLGGKKDYHHKLNWGWGGPNIVPGSCYSEVSMIQSTFSRTNRGNLEVVARVDGMRGFDFFWRDENFVWHGPFHIV